MSNMGKSKLVDAEIQVDILRTPDECFRELPDYNYLPHYTLLGISEITQRIPPDMHFTWNYQ
jgi:hypothetical protein